MRLLLATYHDPAGYPPTINSARTLAKAGHQVWLLGHHRGQHGTFHAGEGIVEVQLGRAPGGYPTLLARKLRVLAQHRRAIVRLCQSEQIDAMVAYDDHTVWAARPLLARLPTVYHVHDMVTPGREHELGRLDRWLHRFMRASLSRLSAVVMPEASRLQLAKAVWRIDRATLVVPNAAPLTAAERHDALARRIAETAGALPEAVIVQAGGGGTVHLVDESVAALAHLPAGFHLVMIGCGGPAFEARMRALAEAHGVSARLHLQPWLCYDDLRVLLRSATVGLALYRKGSTDVNKLHQATASVKLMEYLAAGLPVVANDTPDFHALSARTGGVVHAEAETPGGIAAAIAQAVAGRERLGAEAGRAHREEYHYEKQLAPLVRLLEELR